MIEPPVDGFQMPENSEHSSNVRDLAKQERLTAEEWTMTAEQQNQQNKSIESEEKKREGILPFLAKNLSNYKVNVVSLKIGYKTERQE